MVVASLGMAFDVLPQEDGQHVYEVTAPWLAEPVYAGTWFDAYWRAIELRPRT